MKRYIDTGIHTTLFLDFNGFCALLTVDAGVYAAACWEYWAKSCCGVFNCNMFLVDDLKDVDHDKLQVQFDLPSVDPVQDGEDIDRFSWTRIKDDGMLLIRRTNINNGKGEDRWAADVDLIVDMFMEFVQEVATNKLRSQLISRVAAMLPEYPDSADVHHALMAMTPLPGQDT